MGGIKEKILGPKETRTPTYVCWCSVANRSPVQDHSCTYNNVQACKESVETHGSRKYRYENGTVRRRVTDILAASLRKNGTKLHVINYPPATSAEAKTARATT